MKRQGSKVLADWYRRPSRLPLIVRGARQVGKSYIVRQLARAQQAPLVEVNFEQAPDLADLLASNDAPTMLRNLEAWSGQRIVPGRTILFLDEVQAAPHVLPKLRWFAEQTPDLHVLAAGSLLDGVLDEHAFSMPVGRIAYFYLEPMSFDEFLAALGEDVLTDYLGQFGWHEPISIPVHRRLLDLFRQYVFVGGMPAAVKCYAANRSFLEVAEIQHNLLATFRDDFSKYADRLHRQRLLKVLQSIPRQLGRKFMFSNVDREERTASLKQALRLLIEARLASDVQSTEASGLPLGASTDDRTFKMVLLDMGLTVASLGLSAVDVTSLATLNLINEGALAEQIVGQALRLLQPFYQAPQLYYWSRQKRGSAAEVDYLIQHGRTVLPIEVKAGTTGRLKSLHLLMATTGLKQAIRINGDLPSRVNVDVAVHDGRRATYELISVPFYLITRLPELLLSSAASPPATNPPHEDV